MKHRGFSMNNNDPINGLINYANEIKPYHSKVIEVLTEYVYDEDIQVTVTESLLMNFGISIARVNVNNNFLDSFNGTYGVGPYDTFEAWPVVSINKSLVNGAFDANNPSYNTSNNSVAIPGNQAAVYRIGRDIEIDLYILNTVDGSRTNPPLLNFTIADSKFVPLGQINGIPNNPVTILSLSGNLPDPITLLGSLPDSDHEYVATVRIKPVPIDSVITGYNNTQQISYTDISIGASPSPDPTIITGSSTPSEGFIDGQYANSIVLNGDVQAVYPFGSKIAMLLNNGQEREFTVAHTFYDLTADETIIRVLETIDVNDDYSNAQFVEKFFGLDQAFASQSENIESEEGLVRTSISENISFSWIEAGQADVINGFQFLIQEVNNGDTFSVNGDVTNAFSVGDTINIINSVNNDGNHVITAITLNGQGSDITVSSSLTNSIGGGWLEST